MDLAFLVDQQVLVNLEGLELLVDLDNIYPVVLEGL